MKLKILAGFAIMCVLLTTAFAVPADMYIKNGPDGKAAWTSNPGNCTRNCMTNGSVESNRAFENKTTKVEVIKGGRGFALSGDQFHVVNMIIENTRTIDAAKASKIRDLMQSNNSNKTIGELKKEVLAIIGEPTYNGSLRLGQSNYKFVNTKVASAGNSSTIDADLSPHVKDASGNSSLAGHIKLTIGNHEGSKVASGDLALNGTSYKVLIDMMPILGGNFAGIKGHGYQNIIGGRW